METLLFQSEKAKKILEDEYVLALPTETVYGVGIRWDSKTAYERLISAKKRSPEKPIAVMTGTKFDLSKYFILSPQALNVINHLLPGPLTCLVKAKENAPYQTHLGTYVAGIRIPDKKELVEFLDSLPWPLQVTSANISGQPSTKSFSEVEKIFQNDLNVQGIIEGECDSGTPTSVVSLIGEKPVMIRQGEITLEEIEKYYI